MFDLLLGVAAIAIQPQIPVIRPLPAPQRAPTTTVEQVDAGKLGVKFLPDLVVKEVRVEGDTAIHLLIANEGSADARGQVRASADAYVGATRYYGQAAAFADLPIGATRWIGIDRFFRQKFPTYTGEATSVLGSATSVRASVDPPSSTPAWASQSDPLAGFKPAASTSDCGAPHGCIRESNEGNNELGVEGSSIARGRPD